MTTTIDKMYTIFESSDPTQGDAAFDLDQLKDIVNYGMSAGVSGFIYTKDCVEWFDDNEDTIEEYLSDWYMDNRAKITTSLPLQKVMMRLHLLMHSRPTWYGLMLSSRLMRSFVLLTLTIDEKVEVFDWSDSVDQHWYDGLNDAVNNNLSALNVYEYLEVLNEEDYE